MSVIEQEPIAYTSILYERGGLLILTLLRLYAACDDSHSLVPSRISLRYSFLAQEQGYDLQITII
jgi:hypothetical protein